MTTAVLSRPRPACAGLTVAELEWFCPDDDLPAAVRAEMVENARGVCAGCPIVSRCLSEALADGDVHTVRAGLTPEERAALRPAFLRVRIVAPRHGSHASYQSCTDGLDGKACAKCRAGHAEYMNRWRARGGSPVTHSGTIHVIDTATVRVACRALFEQLVIEGIAS